MFTINLEDGREAPSKASILDIFIIIISEEYFTRTSPREIPREFLKAVVTNTGELSSLLLLGRNVVSTFSIGKNIFKKFRLVN